MKQAEVKRFKLATKYVASSHDKTPFGKAFIEERLDILED